MKLLLDQDVYGLTVKFLIEAGYDLLTVAQLNMSQAPDEEVLKTAQSQNRILITRDRDYGNLIFVMSKDWAVALFICGCSQIP
jgi:predicted nuclease of predicted toxin-antitoxin system